MSLTKDPAGDALIDDIAYESGAMVSYGTTFGGEYKYEVRRGQTWRCP